VSEERYAREVSIRTVKTSAPRFGECAHPRAARQGIWRGTGWKRGRKDDEVDDDGDDHLIASSHLYRRGSLPLKTASPCRRPPAFQCSDKDPETQRIEIVERLARPLSECTIKTSVRLDDEHAHEFAARAGDEVARWRWEDRLVRARRT